MEKVERPKVRTAGRADVRPMAAMLARAFRDDPVMAWMTPRVADRERRLAVLFRTLLRHEHLRHGAVSVACGAGAPRSPGTRSGQGGTLLGAALWDPPGKWNAPAWRELLSMPGYARALGGRIGPAGRALAAIARAHPAEPHWYLAVLGTDPSARGRGAGSALLRPRLERLDRAGEAAYLESSNGDNVPLYEHFGFRVTRELDIPDGGPRLWAMWRDPA